ncbi:MAG: hypothetical protein L6R38_004310 [Xanthoria sp. 2 TBL-2021]|nr:MAG: hypothetical protein L6R38_004310 [Xanthoria sp. 2 TBL-2021]
MPGRAGRNRHRDPFYYWNNTAHTKPEAQELAAELALEIPAGAQMTTGFKSGIVYPIRRLIVTGTDTPTNYTTLLGPLWESKAAKIIEQIRIEVLLCPPPGSPAHVVSEQLDAGAPRWTPRGPNTEEEAELSEARDMQQRLNTQMAERSGGDVKTSDIKEILMGMGGDWTKKLGSLQAAVNNKDQGVGR